MASPISFRPNVEDEQIIASLRAQNQQLSPTDVLRHGLRLAKREQWRELAYQDMDRLSDENLADSPDEWGFDSSGKIVVFGV